MSSKILLSITLLIALCISCSVGNPEASFSKGKTSLEAGKKKDAYKFFKAAARVSPDSAKYHWFAALAAPDNNTAFIHSNEAWKKGMKGVDLFWTLLRLSFHTKVDEKLKYALELYKELPTELQTEILRGDIYFNFGKYDSSIAIYSALAEAKPEPKLTAKIALSYVKKGDGVKAKSILTNARMQKQLEQDGYILLASMLSYDGQYKAADSLYKEALAYGETSDAIQIEYAIHLLMQGEMDQVDAIVKNMLDTVSEMPKQLMNQQARFIYGIVRSTQGDTNAISELQKYIGVYKADWRDAEVKYYDALKLAATDSVTSFAKIKEARKFFNGRLAIELAFVRLAMRNKEYLDALDGFKSLPKTVISYPFMSSEFAYCLNAIGKDDEALMVISSLHKRGIYTKASLELFRDITYKRNLLEKSSAAQKALEEKFGNDAAVKWSGALLALKAGKSDSALIVFTKLAKDFPKESRFEIARISTLFFKGAYEDVIKACESSSFNEAGVHILKARAYRKINKNDNALSAYEQAVSVNYDPHAMLEYADYLTILGKSETAFSVYKEILDKNKSSLQKDSITNAAVLNNLAWTSLESPTSNLNFALSAIEQAHKISSRNLHIIDTYAEVLLRMKKYRECVKLLDSDTTALKEPRLLYHLATALENTRNINKAVRIYKDILVQLDKKNTLPVTFGKDEIQAKINSLTSE